MAVCVWGWGQEASGQDEGLWQHFGGCRQCSKMPGVCCLPNGQALVVTTANSPHL
jgi:hypothetical protein